MKEKEFNSLRSFYPYYLSEHANKTNRVLHFIGTGLVIMSTITFAITSQWSFLAIVPLLGYGFAWFGHFIFERNKPATFQYPGYSLASDFIMFWELLTRQIPFAENKKGSI